MPAHRALGFNDALESYKPLFNYVLQRDRRFAVLFNVVQRYPTSTTDHIPGGYDMLAVRAPFVRVVPSRGNITWVSMDSRGDLLTTAEPNDAGVYVQQTYSASFDRFSERAYTSTCLDPHRH